MGRCGRSMRIDEVPIESPCDEDLDRMRLGPGGLDRHCDRCEKSVHDLSAMGPERARAFLAANGGSICISYISDRRGELVFEPAHAPARPKSDFVPLARLAQAATLAASLAACTPHGHDPPPQVHEAQIEESPRGVRGLGRMSSPPDSIPTIEAPPKPAIEEPCEPTVEPEVEPQPRPERDRVPVKGRRKTAGVYKPLDVDPLG